jgi:hypothetical protein
MAGREHICEDAQGNQLQTNGGRLNPHITDRGLTRGPPQSLEICLRMSLISCGPPSALAHDCETSLVKLDTLSQQAVMKFR